MLFSCQASWEQGCHKPLLHSLFKDYYTFTPCFPQVFSTTWLVWLFFLCLQARLMLLTCSDFVYFLILLNFWSIGRSLTCRAQCTEGSQPSSERAAWSHSRNQSHLRKKSNTIKTCTNKYITCLPHRSTHYAYVRVHTRAQTHTHTCAHTQRWSWKKMWQPHVVTFIKLLSPAEMWRWSKSHFSAKSLLHSAVQEHRELLLSCLSLHSMWARVCGCLSVCLCVWWSS